MDEDMGLLNKICNALDTAWEDYIYDPATDLTTLFEVKNIDAKWLSYLKPLLGFTRDIPFDANEQELRKILARALPFWNYKPSELGVIAQSIRMVSGNPFLVRNYFDFRMVIDEVVLGEEAQDFDPWCVDFFGKIATDLTVSIRQVTPGASPATFTVTGGLSSLFQTPYDYRYFVIDEPESYAGVYRIDSLTPYSLDGVAILPRSTSWPASPTMCTARLYGAMDEFLTEVRLVDDRVGTLTYDTKTAGTFTVGDTVLGAASGAKGIIVAVSPTSLDSGNMVLKFVRGRFIDDETITSFPGGGSASAKGQIQDMLNRHLLRFLMNVVRPNSERVRVRYIDLLDTFDTDYNLDQWAITGAPVAQGNKVLLAAGDTLITNSIYADGWGDGTVTWKVTPQTDAIVEGVFRYLNTSNYYALRLNLVTKKIYVVKKYLGAETVIAMSSTLRRLKAGVTNVMRVSAINVMTSAVEFQVTLDGENPFGTPHPQDVANPLLTGKVGAACSSQSGYFHFIEADVWPVEADHIGPPPSDITHPALPL